MTAAGNGHKWRCKNTSEMKRWIVALRNAADNAALSVIVVAEEGGSEGGVEKPGAVKRTTSQGTIMDILKGAGGGGGLGGGGGKGAESPGVTPEVTLDTLLAKTYVRVRVKAEGPTKVLELSEEGGEGGGDDEEEEGVGLAKNGGRGGLLQTSYSKRSLLNQDSSVHGSTSLSNTADEQKMEEEAKKIRLDLIVNFGLGISVIDKARENTAGMPRELIFMNLENVSVRTRQSNSSMELSLTVDGLQVDNQLHDAVCPVIIGTRRLLSRGKLEQINRANPELGGGGRGRTRTTSTCLG